MEFSTHVQSMTDTKLIPKLVDTVLSSSPFTLTILGNQKTFSGTSMKFPVRTSQNDEGGSFDGMDKFSTTKVETQRVMEFNPTGYSKPVVVSNMELDVNATEKGVLNQLQLATAQTAQDMIDGLADIFYAFQSGKDFLGVYDAVDDGTTTASYGGLSRSTYTGLAGNLTSSSGTLTLAKMRTMFNSCTHGTQNPNLLITTKSLWAAYEALLETSVSRNAPTSGYPQVTRTGSAPNTQALKGEAGFDSLYFAGAPIVFDDKIDSGYMLFINTNHLGFYGLASSQEGWTQVKFQSSELDSVYSEVPVTTGFSWSGLMRPIDQYGQVGHLILMGQLISDSPRHLGILTGLS